MDIEPEQTLYFIQKMPLWLLLVVKLFSSKQKDVNTIKTALLCSGIIPTLPKNRIGKMAKIELSKWITAFVVMQNMENNGRKQ